jgi:hypothetical protein
MAARLKRLFTVLFLWLLCASVFAFVPEHRGHFQNPSIRRNAMITLDTATLWLYPVLLLAGLALVSSISVQGRRVKRQDQASRKVRTPYVLVAITSSITLFACF